MYVELITIGDELLLGFTIDTNAAFIARELAAIGVEIARHGTVGDDAEMIASAVREALERTGAVITTGGLGPTSDDKTRPAIAELLGRAMREDAEIVQQLERRFTQLGYPMPQTNRAQALVPEGARLLRNRHGTAPGLWMEDERGRWVVMLPGVPREMRGMMRDELLPLLSERVGENPPVLLSRTLRTTGIGESALAELLGEHARQVDGMAVASLPGWEGTDLRITAHGLPAAVADAKLAAGIATLRARVERYVYGQGSADLAALVLDLCRSRRLRVATAESCTGGMLGERITAVPGSSDVYLGGVIAYANDAKVKELGVDPHAMAQQGAVSEIVARQMAAGICSRFGTEIGVGITGIAGPDGGTAEKPVGTVWIAVQNQGAPATLGRVYVGDRDEIRRRACQSALDLIRRPLAGLPT